MITFTVHDPGNQRGDEIKVGELVGQGWSTSILRRIAQAISEDQGDRTVWVYDHKDAVVGTATPTAWKEGYHDPGTVA